jgi:hypothetical protein
LAYVSVSRGRYDAQIYTNNAQNLSEELSRVTSKPSAFDAERRSAHSRGDAHTQEESRTEEAPKVRKWSQNKPSSMVWPWKIDRAGYSDEKIGGPGSLSCEAEEGLKN